MDTPFILRRNSRIMVLQALYAELFTGYPVETIESHAWERSVSSIDIEYFVDVFRGVIKFKDVLNECINPYLDRELNLMNPVELCLLKMATYELKERPDVPFQVIINETVEISKLFGSKTSYRYVNGIIDHVAFDVRPDEVKAYRAYRESKAQSNFT